MEPTQNDSVVDQESQEPNQTETAPRNDNTIGAYWEYMKQPRKWIYSMFDRANFKTEIAILIFIGTFSNLLGNAKIEPEQSVDTLIFKVLIQSVIVALLNYFVVSGILYGFFKLFKGQGTYQQTQYALSLAYVPAILSLVLDVILISIIGSAYFTDELIENYTIVNIGVIVIIGLLQLVLGIWMFILYLVNMSAVHQLSKRKVFFVSLIPGFVFIVIVTLFFSILFF